MENGMDTCCGVIRKYVSSQIRGLYEQGNALGTLNHRVTKGELRELFLSKLLCNFLTSQLEVASGVVINSAGFQSKQSDIIIYDNRILPPFIKEQRLGVYPVESVIATIEVKSHLQKKHVEEEEIAARALRDAFAKKKDHEELRAQPLAAIVGFSDASSGLYSIACEETQQKKEWLKKNVRNLIGICVIGKFCWMNVTDRGWRVADHDNLTFEETKRFIAVVADNIRCRSQRRLQFYSARHNDWLSDYIRDKGVLR